MLLRFLDHMRTQPHLVRKRFALLFSVVVTGIIAAFWITSLPAQFAALRISGTGLMGSAEVANLADKLGEGKENVNAIIETGKQAQGMFGGTNDAPQNPPQSGAGETQHTQQTQGAESTSATQMWTPQQEVPIMIETTSTPAVRTQSNTVLVATSTSKLSQ